MKKLIVLLMVALMLFSLCACSAEENTPTTQGNNTTAGTDNETTDGNETTVGNDETTDGNGTTEGEDFAEPEDPNGINCYFGYYDLNDKPAYTIRVSSPLIAEGYHWSTYENAHISPFVIDEDVFVTDEIIEKEKNYYNFWDDGASVLAISRDSDSLMIVSVGFIDHYGYEKIMEDGDSITSYTAASSHTYTQYSSHGRTCYILDLGLENCWVHVEQLLGGSGTEFETLTFKLIEN